MEWKFFMNVNIILPSSILKFKGVFLPLKKIMIIKASDDENVVLIYIYAYNMRIEKTNNVNCVVYGFGYIFDLCV